VIHDDNLYPLGSDTGPSFPVPTTSDSGVERQERRRKKGDGEKEKERGGSGLKQKREF
jgi:hypothetical protein